MPSFGKSSRAKLDTCHQDIQLLCQAVIDSGFDITILEGHRSNERQAELLKEGKTKVGPGKSKHNSNPSRAVDIAPWPIDWEDREQFTFLAGYMKGMAAALGIKIRWGGDWDQDFQLSDNRFDDLPHFELIGE